MSTIEIFLSKYKNQTIKPEKQIKKEELTMLKNSAKKVHIFVGGNYTKGKYFWYFAAFAGNKRIHSQLGEGTNEEAAKARHVAGELSAAMRAMNWAKKTAIKSSFATTSPVRNVC
jgi:hypothetical protein